MEDRFFVQNRAYAGRRLIVGAGAVAFDSEGVSGPLPEAEYRRLLTIPGFECAGVGVLAPEALGDTEVLPPEGEAPDGVETEVFPEGTVGEAEVAPPFPVPGWGSMTAQQRLDAVGSADLAHEEYVALLNAEVNGRNSRRVVTALERRLETMRGRAKTAEQVNAALLRASALVPEEA